MAKFSNFKDCVRVTSTSQGTGNMVLGSAVAGFQAFSDVFSAETELYYEIDDGVSSRETGKGKWLGGNSLQRDTVIFSTNSNAKIDWPSGTKDVRLTVSSEFLRPVHNYYGDNTTNASFTVSYTTASAWQDSGWPGSTVTTVHSSRRSSLSTGWRLSPDWSSSGDLSPTAGEYLSNAIVSGYVTCPAAATIEIGVATHSGTAPLPGEYYTAYLHATTGSFFSHVAVNLEQAAIESLRPVMRTDVVQTYTFQKLRFAVWGGESKSFIAF